MATIVPLASELSLEPVPANHIRGFCRAQLIAEFGGDLDGSGAIDSQTEPLL